MHRDIIIANWPYVIAMLAALAGLRLLVRISGARVRFSRLVGLHRDESGAVQSLSFVLTLPLFIMILLLLVQLSQLVIGRLVVEYAAFATARSAIVWIPANLGRGTEQENRISSYRLVDEFDGVDGYRYREYEIEPQGVKYAKIHSAAAMACLPICPSHNVGTPRDHPGNDAAAALLKMYHAFAEQSNLNSRISDRLRNKLAFALNNTHARIRIRHKHEEPDLEEHRKPPYPEEFTFNEIGWQDQILVTVTHDFALLPGVGRIMGRRASETEQPSPSGDPSPSQGDESQSSQRQGNGDPAADRVRRRQNVFVFPLSATVRLNNEGEKSVLPYIQTTYGEMPEGGTYPPSQEEEESPN